MLRPYNRGHRVAIHEAVEQIAFDEANAIRNGMARDVAQRNGQGYR